MNRVELNERNGTKLDYRLVCVGEDGSPLSFKPNQFLAFKHSEKYFILKSCFECISFGLCVDIGYDDENDWIR